MCEGRGGGVFVLLGMRGWGMPSATRMFFAQNRIFLTFFLLVSVVCYDTYVSRCFAEDRLPFFCISVLRFEWYIDVFWTTVRLSSFSCLVSCANNTHVPSSVFDGGSFAFFLVSCLVPAMVTFFVFFSDRCTGHMLSPCFFSPFLCYEDIISRCFAVSCYSSLYHIIGVCYFVWCFCHAEREGGTPGTVIRSLPVLLLILGSPSYENVHR